MEQQPLLITPITAQTRKLARLANTCVLLFGALFGLTCIFFFVLEVIGVQSEALEAIMSFHLAGSLVFLVPGLILLIWWRHASRRKQIKIEQLEKIVLNRAPDKFRTSEFAGIMPIGNFVFLHGEKLEITDKDAQAVLEKAKPKTLVIEEAYQNVRTIDQNPNHVLNDIVSVFGGTFFV